MKKVKTIENDKGKLTKSQNGEDEKEITQIENKNL